MLLRSLFVRDAAGVIHSSSLSGGTLTQKACKWPHKFNPHQSSCFVPGRLRPYHTGLASRLSIKGNRELGVDWECVGDDQAGTCSTQVPGSGARARLTQARCSDLHCKIQRLASPVLLSLPDGRIVDVEYRRLPDDKCPEKEAGSGHA